MPKKSFSAQNNPALAYISQQQEPTKEVPEGYKPNPLYIETKSRRMQLLVQPSLYDAIKARATAEGVSVNELVHSILEAAVKGE